MAQGTLKWFSLDTDYGLITPDGGGRNLFVRGTGFADGSGPKTLEKGDKVTYQVTQGRNGMRATKVSKRLRYSWRDDSRERHEGKEARNKYYAGLERAGAPRVGPKPRVRGTLYSLLAGVGAGLFVGAMIILATVVTPL